MAKLGSNVTLRSLLPETTSTVRVSEFQPEFGGRETTTVCGPTATLMLMGVTLPVSTSSTETLAPVGNEVTFNAPLPPCAPALSAATKSTTANTVIHTILLVQTTLLGWFIRVLLDPQLNSFTRT